MLVYKVNFCFFVDNFRDSIYKNIFSYSGLFGLYNYLNGLDGVVDFDIISICENYIEINNSLQHPADAVVIWIGEETSIYLRN